MAIGFPASSKWSHNFGVDQLIMRQLVRSALTAMNWLYSTPEAQTTIAKVPANMLTWGETVTVTVEDDGTILATSTCAWPLQVVDWGKNRTNLNELHKNLIAAIRNSDLDPRQLPSHVDERGTTPLERALQNDDS